MKKSKKEQTRIGEKCKLCNQEAVFDGLCEFCLWDTAEQQRKYEKEKN